MTRTVAAIINVGLGGAVDAARVVAIGPLSAVRVRRAVQGAEADGRLIDLTQGRRARSALFLESGQIVRISLTPATARERWEQALRHTGLVDDEAAA